MTTGDRNKIESYLAVKYGITLDQTSPTNYVNSAGTILYPSATTHSGFSKDVAGITKDDGSGLNQIKSKSVNAGSIVEIESPTALNNNDYLMAGDNGADITLRSTDVPAGYGQRLQRVWRVSKSATPGAVTIRMFIGDIPELLRNPNLSSVALLKSPSNSFASATPISGTLIGSDILEFTGVSFNNDDYFTLAIGTNTFPTTFDFEFWYGVPAWAPGFDSPQKIHFTGVSATEYAAYSIDMPANPGFTPITGMVAPKGSQIVDLTTLINNITVKPANTVVNRGLRIRISGRMGAYYANEKNDNYGTFPLRGPNALGTSFIIPGQNIFNIGAFAGAKSLFVVTATQDATQVTITPSEAITGHGANVPFTITLNKGQSYSAEAIASNGKHLGGSLVTSNFPAVVTYSDDLLAYGFSGDNAGDQLVPISKFGLKYVHIRASLQDANRESVFIFGSEDGTTITTFDGTTTTTLVVDKGKYVRYTLPAGKNASSIIADKPVMVYQMGGYTTELGAGILTPIATCKGAKVIAFQYPTSANNATFNFVAPHNIVGAFLINGSSTIITASDFIDIPGENPANPNRWQYCRKDITSFFTRGQVISVENTMDNFYFYQNLYSTGGGDFSNFSDFGNMVLFPKANHVCGSNTITLNSGAIAYNVNVTGYHWTGPNGFTSNLPNPVLTNPTVANVGTYVLTVTDDGGCSYSENLVVDLPIDSITITPEPTTPCVGSTVQFESSFLPVDAVPASVSWTGPNGFTSTEANFTINGVTAHILEPILVLI